MFDATRNDVHKSLFLIGLSWVLPGFLGLSGFGHGGGFPRFKNIFLALLTLKHCKYSSYEMLKKRSQAFLR